MKNVIALISIIFLFSCTERSKEENMNVLLNRNLGILSANELMEALRYNPESKQLMELIEKNNKMIKELLKIERKR